jgi:hypothetical protein
MADHAGKILTLLLKISQNNSKIIHFVLLFELPLHHQTHKQLKTHKNENSNHKRKRHKRNSNNKK